MENKTKKVSLTFLCVVMTFLYPARADDFYQNKTIQLVVGTDAGGSYDLSARLIGRVLPKHLPGTPALVVQNMPGAGSVTAANFVYNIAPQDGTVIGAFVQTLPLTQLLGGAHTKFDVSRFNWIGNPT